MRALTYYRFSWALPGLSGALLGLPGAFLVCAALSISSSVQASLRLAQNGGGEARVIFESLDGTLKHTPLASVQLGDPREEGAHFLRFEGLPAPAPSTVPSADRVRLSLTNGDQVRGAVVGGDGDILHVEVLAGTTVPFSILGLRSLTFPGRLEAGGIEVLPPEQGDRLYRKRGIGVDRVDGLVNGFDATGVQFESNLGERTYAWIEVAALFVEVFDEDLAGEAAEDSPGVPVSVDLIGGSRLRGQLLGLNASGASLRIGEDVDLQLPIAALLGITVEDDSYRLLSTMTPAGAGPASPYGDDLGMVWGHRMDHDFHGAALRSGGRTWPRGIWVHAPSRLTWNLAGDWKELRSHVGLDDAVAGSARASVIFRVFVDGEERFASDLMRGGAVPLALPVIDVKGAKELVLEVDEATDFHVRDRAIWLRPFLVGK